MPTGGNQFAFNCQLSLIFWNYNSNITYPYLMKDQVDSLKANGIEACFINNGQTSADNKCTLKT
jgi:ATP-dependent DNA helicase RecQ